MIKFIRDIFLVLFFISLITTTVVGGFIGSELHPSFGTILGALVGFITCIAMFGWVVVLLNIDENLQKIADKMVGNPMANIASNRKVENSTATTVGKIAEDEKTKNIQRIVGKLVGTSIVFECPECQKQYSVDQRRIGKMMVCKVCDKPLTIPEPEEPAN